MDRIEELKSLARAATNGRPETLSELLRESAGIVHALARARLGDNLAADEAAADALARVARSIMKLRDPIAYPAWLATITARCAADAARKNARVLAPSPEDVPDFRDGPDAVAEASERAWIIRRAVQQLPRRLREPVLLHFVEGLNYREIATTLGTGLGTVARRMAKALRSLKQHLGERP